MNQLLRPVVVNAKFKTLLDIVDKGLRVKNVKCLQHLIYQVQRTAEELFSTMKISCTIESLHKQIG